MSGSDKTSRHIPDSAALRRSAAAATSTPDTLMVSGPAESESVYSDSAKSNPAESNPADSDPVDSDPVDSDPVDSDPVDSDPVDSGTADAPIVVTTASAHASAPKSVPDSVSSPVSPQLLDQQLDSVLDAVAPLHAEHCQPTPSARFADLAPTLHAYINPDLQSLLERKYWEGIVDAATVRSLINDDHFMQDPAAHMTLFSDHSKTHARDVASRVVDLIQRLNGELFAARDQARLQFMSRYGVLLAFVHDIGMAFPGSSARRLHAQYVANLVFTPDFEDTLDAIVESTCLHPYEPDDAARTALQPRAARRRRQLFQQLLAMAMCHSKSAVPGKVLNDARAHYRYLRVACFTPFEKLVAAMEQGDWLDAESPADMQRYAEPHETFQPAFNWLQDAPSLTSGQARDFRDDILDTVRVLRIADALRQRGTDLRTSAGFEVFIDDAGQAVFALASDVHDSPLHLQVDSELSVGEANMCSCELLPGNTLEFGFHRGCFSLAVQKRVARACARVVADVAIDVQEATYSLEMPTISLVNPPDSPLFKLWVAESLEQQLPELAGRIRLVPCTSGWLARDREYYLNGETVAAGSVKAGFILQQLKATGLPIDHLMEEHCFTDVRVISLLPGDTLVGRGEAADFVYIPWSRGLVLQPGGGFAPRALAAWQQVGATGVIRHGPRNSTIISDTAMQVLMIPGEVFVKFWYRPLSVSDLRRIYASESDQYLDEISEPEPVPVPVQAEEALVT